MGTFSEQVLGDIEISKLKFYFKETKSESSVGNVKPVHPPIRTYIHSMDAYYVSAKFQARVNVLKKLKAQNKIGMLITTTEGKQCSVPCKLYR